MPLAICVEIPPINSRTKLFAFTSAYIEPMYISLENISSEYLIENVKSKIIDINIWINRRERKLLNQTLKNQEKVSKESEIIAKGEIRIKTLIITYLSE